MISFRLQSRGPINLALCNQPVTEFEPDRDAFDGTALYRAGTAGGSPILLRAWNVTNDEIEVEVKGADEGELPGDSVLVPYLRRRFSLDLDLPAFYRFARTDSRLPEFSEEQKGLRPMLKDSLFEALCLAIVDQQINVAFATTLKKRLFEKRGTAYSWEGHTLWHFPTPEKLAALEPETLRPLQFSRSKASYMIDLARTFLSDPTWEQQEGSDEEVVSRLTTLRGVGPWTAEYAAISGLGRVDTLPAADIALLRIAQQVMNLPERPTPEQMRELALPWRGWRGLVTFYLWHLDDLNQG